MPILSTVIALTEDQAQLVRRTARLFSMDVAEFLAAALESGIAHAQSLMGTELDDPEPEPKDDEFPWPGPDSPDAYLPF